MRRRKIFQVRKIICIALPSAKSWYSVSRLLDRFKEVRNGERVLLKPLKKWEVDYKAILKEIPDTPETADKSSLLLSVYYPQIYSLEVPDRSPMHHRLRPRKTTCRLGSDPTS